MLNEKYIAWIHYVKLKNKTKLFRSAYRGGKIKNKSKEIITLKDRTEMIFLYLSDIYMNVHFTPFAKLYM